MVLQFMKYHPVLLFATFVKNLIGSLMLVRSGGQFPCGILLLPHSGRGSRQLLRLIPDRSGKDLFVNPNMTLP